MFLVYLFAATTAIVVKTKATCHGIWCMPPVDITECKGSIKLFKNGSLDQIISVHETSNLPPRISFDSLKVEGCLCYKIYKTRNLGGKQAKLWQGYTYTKEEVGFGRFRRLKAVKCESLHASGSWIVVVIIAVVGLLVMIAGVLGLKCYRKSNGQSNQSRLESA